MGGDLYEAMTRVSLATLRLTNPTARIEIACDQQTLQALRTSGSRLLSEADAVRGFPTPDGPPTYRNRYVKTQLGRLIDGPFLFLDSDTVVRKPLTSLLDLHCDIAVAPNHSRDTLAEQIWSEDQANLDTMGWQVREPYVNGGVIWYSGTAGSRLFADVWHQNWLANVEATGRYRDQPSLNLTASSLVHNLFILKHAWNAQIHGSPKEIPAALIWHLSLEWDKQQILLFTKLLDDYGTGSRLHPIQLASTLVSSKHPWVTRSLLDELAVSFVISRNRLHPFVATWLSCASPILSTVSINKVIMRGLRLFVSGIRRLRQSLFLLATYARLLICNMSGSRFFPWSGYTLLLTNPIISSPIGMITSSERAWLCWYANEIYTGRGFIVELGSFVGASTVALAFGLRNSKKLSVLQATKQVRVYDRFICGGYEAELLNSIFRTNSYSIGSSFYDLFSQQVAPFQSSIDIYSGDLLQQQHDGQPIELLFVDAMKDQMLMHHILAQFFPSLIPGTSLIVQQDFVHYYTSWIHILMYKLRYCCKFIYHIPRSASAIFRVIDTSGIATMCTRDCFDMTDLEVDEAFNYSKSLIHGPMQENIYAAEAMHYIHAGRHSKAAELVQAWQADHAKPEYEMANVISLLSS